MYFIRNSFEGMMLLPYSTCSCWFVLKAAASKFKKLLV
jgi:hypothetical protein